MDENQIRVLGTYSRPCLEIELIACNATSAGTSALAELLGRNQGPTRLYYCEIDCYVLADGLRGNSHLKGLALRFSSSSSSEDDKRRVLAIATALRENKGLIEFNLFHHDCTVSDEMWYAICDSLKTHSTLEVLDLSPGYTSSTVPAAITSRIQALLDMMKINMSIHTIHLYDRISDHAFFRGSVIPYLATNRLRPRVRAIQTIRPIPYRVGVLGRALLVSRSDANSFWMLLSGNAEVAFPSTTATIAAAASLPTSATTAAMVSGAATLTGFVTLALTDSATASLPSTATSSAVGTFTPSTYPSEHAVVVAAAAAAAAAPSVATSSAGQKRRASPQSCPG